jgi:hypothetical protein
MRQKYIESKKLDGYGNPDYSFISPLLDIKRFTLSDPTITGMRRASMTKFDLFRLPENAHFTNVYPVGEACGSNDIGEVTQVSPGEENFYLTPDFSNYLFFVVKGRGINTYNIPPCIKEVDIETTYQSDDIDVSLDLAYEVVMQVLGNSLKVNGVPIKILDNAYAPQPSEVKRKLKEADTNE